jgi:putative two-component system response regulator
MLKTSKLFIVARSLEGLIMFKSQRKIYLQENAESIFLAAYAAELREWDNRAHLKRIRDYSFTLCLALDIPRPEAEQISLSCLLHDIGKSATPEELLTRQGQYEEQEWKLMERHTLDGEEMLRDATSSILRMGASIAATHHERWDGSGYPHGLSGDSIPLPGQVCAIADVFDALTTLRSYKKPLDIDHAYDLIQRSSGSLFNPQIVQAFVTAFPDLLRIKNSSAD